MKLPFVILQIGNVLLLSLLGALLAMIVALGVDVEVCGDIHGGNAPGGGAAVGMFVAILIGFPVFVWIALSETVLRILHGHTALRLISIFLPSVVTYIWMFQYSIGICG